MPKEQCSKTSTVRLRNVQTGPGQSFGFFAPLRESVTNLVFDL